MRDLLAAVDECWENFPVKRMDNIWQCLFTSYKGILQSRGNNDFCHHTGRHTPSQTKGAADHHDQSFPLEPVKAAEPAHDRIFAKSSGSVAEVIVAADTTSDDSE